MKKVRKSPTADQKAWMKENGYIERQMDEFWQDNIDTNPVIKKLNAYGMSWRDVSLSCVQQLPTQKERDLEAKRQKMIEEQHRLEAVAKAKADEDYYWDHFKEIMVEKIEKTIPVTEWIKKQA